MCGIIGILSRDGSAAERAMEALRRLEYRGYDSAGIATLSDGKLDRRRAAGKLSNLRKLLIEAPIPGSVGIGHTRWATHGAANTQNAHPHVSGPVALVHNGIIENFRELKEEMTADGIAFYSDTDTEVLAKLIGTLHDGDLVVAVQTALARVRGTYGLMAVAADAPEHVVTARMGSPVVLGLAADGNLISSDPSALLEHTKDVIYLEDGEMAVVTKDAYEVMTVGGESLDKAPETIEWDAEAVQKQGYDHFMLKEIFEAPEVIRNTLRGRLLADKGRAKLGGLEEVLDMIVDLDRLVIVACGTANYAGQIGRYMLEEYAGLPVRRSPY